MRKLKDSVVVVTGASSGIGLASALAFADRRATVVVTARREAVLADVVRHCRDRGAEALAVPADITDPVAVEAVARQAVERFGRLDVWVNNAAVNLYAPVEESPPELWHRVVETNLFGTYHGVRAALPWMREQGSGVLVNVSSVLGKIGSPYQSSYVASKHAIRALSDCVRQELTDVPGVAVCTVLPGPIDTPLFDHAGNHTGRRITPPKPVIAADRVAASIVSCTLKPRREAVVGSSTVGALTGNRLAPGLVERAAAKQVEQDHFGDAPAPASDGNLFAPADGDGSVSGGWTRAARKVDPDDRRAASTAGSPKKVLALAGVAGATAVAVARALRR